ncbi:mitochondrial import inner membrane translocase [Striga asiatica]|uniref:Mitochondrial import inner membrane translocase n=1 Tax=Striga asiatica TaxID=4170 RepID=A0A5A7P585_STRAF|nr:mitochondrial import inner membrane translocase [Striga asiatica]
MSGSNLETRSLIDELRSFDSGGFFDLGHPLLNRIAESFIKAAGIGAVQAVSREAYFTAVESASGDTGGTIAPEIGASKKRHQFPDLRGENNRKSVEALVMSTGKESMQWVTGAALALTTEDHSHEQIVQCAITGAAISTAANLLTGIF